MRFVALVTLASLVSFVSFVSVVSLVSLYRYVTFCIKVGDFLEHRPRDTRLWESLFGSFLVRF